jgi:hypothetical protein
MFLPGYPLSSLRLCWAVSQGSFLRFSVGFCSDLLFFPGFAAGVQSYLGSLLGLCCEARGFSKNFIVYSSALW